MPGINDKLAENFIAHAVDLLRLGEGIRGEVLYFLYQLQNDVRSQVIDAGLADTLQVTERQRRLKALLREIEETISTAYREIKEHVDDQLLEVGDISNQRNIAIINDVFNSEVATTSLTRHTLEELVSESMIQGAVSKEWWDKQNEDTRQRFTNELRMGMGAGESNDQIVRRLIGRSTGRKIQITNAKGKSKWVYEYSGGKMDVSRREATALVRTGRADGK
jgi:hypothetical protein